MNDDDVRELWDDAVFHNAPLKFRDKVFVTLLVTIVVLWVAILVRLAIMGEQRLHH